MDAPLEVPAAFQFECADGHRPRFGLVEIDRGPLARHRARAAEAAHG